MSVIEPPTYWKIVIGRFARSFDLFEIIRESCERVTKESVPHRVCLCGESHRVPDQIIHHMARCQAARNHISETVLNAAREYVERCLSLVFDDGDDRLDDFLAGKEITLSSSEVPRFSLPEHGAFSPERFPLRRRFFKVDKNSMSSTSRYQKLLEGHTVESYCEHVTHNSL